MDLSAPHLAVLPGTTGGVLAVLAGTDRPLTGREVVRLGGGAHSTVARTLKRLTEHGLVNVQEAGGAAVLHTMNRERLAAGPVLALMNLRRRLIGHLKSELEDWRVLPLHASLFGSAARGDGNTQSDVDLFVVRPNGAADEDG